MQSLNSQVVLPGLVVKDLVSLDGDEFRINTTDGRRWRFYHNQDCCEHVRITDIKGDARKILIGQKIVSCSEDITHPGDESACESCTITTYTFVTEKGSLVVEWTGESNGYYSESVTFEQVN